MGVSRRKVQRRPRTKSDIARAGTISRKWYTPHPAGHAPLPPPQQKQKRLRMYRFMNSCCFCFTILQVLKLCEELYTSGSLPDWPGLHSLPRTPPHSSSSPFSPRPWDMLGDLSGSEMGVLTGERDTTARGSTGDREPRRSTGGDLHGCGSGASGGASGAGGGGGGSGSGGPGANSRCVVLWRAYEYSRLVCLTVGGRAFTMCSGLDAALFPHI